MGRDVFKRMGKSQMAGCFSYGGTRNHRNIGQLCALNIAAKAIPEVEKINEPPGAESQKLRQREFWM